MYPEDTWGEGGGDPGESWEYPGGVLGRGALGDTLGVIPQMVSGWFLVAFFVVPLWFSRGFVAVSICFWGDCGAGFEMVSYWFRSGFLVVSEYLLGGEADPSSERPRTLSEPPRAPTGPLRNPSELPRVRSECPQSSQEPSRSLLETPRARSPCHAMT